MKWLKRIFKTNDTNIDSMKKFLIVGLGNIGSEYVNTRHNIGFKVLDYMANQESSAFQTVKLGDVAEVKIKGRSLFLLKPNTYMNLSGKAVKYWMEKENIPKENILVITDDLNLPFGTIRIKSKGSDGGHNGLKNIQLLLNTAEYPRFRFGISDAFKKGQQVNYVLGEWSEEEKEKLKERLEVATEIIKSFALAGLNNTMNTFNGK
ncbi:MAG: aminoacyl-tRNA hydrolase [Flavobacterium sp.]|uniref:aminoacyl-tRNA hydrolase n=1 Tax=unclassified Flavobacterium TaxID=196869 RepID=UPI000C5554DE|nr:MULTISPECIES: aminoacyl-tRNA hydrolase [unclassified Flavobacterium]MBF02310.1 aminoacyl-tRNA hydrolase [Flavobacterium sp.]MCO6161572.1 aminoacyl-tRNA hydrolase [Flavobacterium sp. NRK F7]|tara:strand:- start:3410 stop:4027 length:618 start_codon:yes stop_codon:yes gene_type:complete